MTGDKMLALAGELSLSTRSGLPDDLKLLLAHYPREIWTGHANLGEMASFWLSRHAMFRELGAMLDDAAARFRAGDIDAQHFAGFRATSAVLPAAASCPSSHRGRSLFPNLPQSRCKACSWL